MCCYGDSIKKQFKLKASAEATSRIGVFTRKFPHQISYIDMIAKKQIFSLLKIVSLIVFSFDHFVATIY